MWSIGCAGKACTPSRQACGRVEWIHGQFNIVVANLTPCCCCLNFQAHGHVEDILSIAVDASSLMATSSFDGEVSRCGFSIKWS